jgi:predicted ATPase
MDVVESARLVTLVGAPGCGKTRLGLEVSARLAERLLARVILVVLDTCEHVRDAVGDLVVRMLGGCPSVRILATSRCVLGLPGEHVWRVPPLELGSAVDLFRDRASLRAPDRSIEATSAETVEQICRRLDCLPLAIELVAVWSPVVTPTEILDRLDSASPLLQSHLRDADARHRTMNDAVTWSYQLLAPAEQLLFEQLSTFAPGFDLEAAQAVATSDDVLDGLASLVGMSSLSALAHRLQEPIAHSAGRGGLRDDHGVVEPRA